MGKIFEAMSNFFKGDGWPIHQIDTELAYSMTFQGENGKWTCIAQAVEEKEVFIFYSICPINTPENKYSQMAELITRANYGLLIGNFEMSFADGDTRLKTSIDIEGTSTLEIVIQQLVYMNVLTMDNYLPAMMKVIYTDVLPAQAIAQVEESLELVML
ncbi:MULTISPECIES: YbjN domain-containing protein [Nostoc]|uniref:YbjN domain-containing protein n=1 Tax=Nostoc paludosum FACHB-159 TaxID=2692908 RepID=A0ABR8KI84_9NOSO|nr:MULTISPECIES: YbjN domain-containing protein [Nostoc]MBD2681278.1 YbjN domain-containing protein [Nostoc sp. FACHB-857]MBD2737757.1 YbjN domain-containing protein [Nostoc paludosum FACHB-159]